MKRLRNIDAISLIVFCALIGEVALLLFQMDQIRWSSGGASSSLRVGTVTQKEESLKRRGQRQLSWHSIEVGAPVFLSDSLLTGSNGRAVVWLDDKTNIELGAETLLKISRNLLRQDGQETWVIQLQQGSTHVSGSGFVKIRSGEFEADLSKGAKLSLNKKPLDSKPKILVAEGAVRWKSPQRSAYTMKDQIQEKPASIFSPPVFPAGTNVSESVIESLPAPQKDPALSPTLGEAPKAVHTKRGANKRAVTNPPISTPAIDPASIALPTEQVGGTVNKIAAQNPTAPIEAPMEKDGGPPVIENRALLAPTLGEATHPPFTRIELLEKSSRTIMGELSIPVTFHWGTVPNAIGYFIEIAEIPTFEIVLGSLEVQAAPLILNLKSPGDYFWRVSAISSDRKVSEWSKVGKLSMEQIPDPEDDLDPGE